MRASRLAVSLAILVLVSTPVFAQDNPYRVSAVVVGSGENPITSGLAGTVQLKNKKGGYMEVTAQEEQAWFMAGKDFERGRWKANLYGSAGHLQGAPWVGPYTSASFSFTKDVSFSIMSWPGFFIGREPAPFRNDDVKNPEKLKVGWFEMGSLNAGPVSFFISHVNFLDTPNNWLPGIGYNHAFGDDIELNTSAMWNKNADRAMYYIGATWRPKK